MYVVEIDLLYKDYNSDQKFTITTYSPTGVVSLFFISFYFLLFFVVILTDLEICVAVAYVSRVLWLCFDLCFPSLSTLFLIGYYVIILVF